MDAWLIDAHPLSIFSKNLARTCRALVAQGDHITGVYPVPRNPVVLRHDEIDQPLDLLRILRVLQSKLLAHDCHQAVTRLDLVCPHFFF